MSSISNILESFGQISTFVFDIDGVLTDGTVLVMDDGLQARRMNIKDGFALQLAVVKGYRVLVISGGNCPQVLDRLQKLGVTDVHLAVKDKQALLLRYMQENGLDKKEVLYMGDDLPDLPAMQLAGLPCCPADAVPEVKSAASYISSYSGGMTCVRDVICKVLSQKGQWGYEPAVASR